MNAPVAAPLGSISTFVNGVQNPLTSLLQECERNVRGRLEYYTTPRHHNGRPIHPEYIMSLAGQFEIDLDNLQGLEEQRINDFREKLENQKDALENWSARLIHMIKREFTVIVNLDRERDDLDRLLRENRDLQGQLARKDQENRELQNDLNFLVRENRDRQGQLLRRDQENQQLQNDLNGLVRENQDRQEQLLRREQEYQQLQNDLNLLLRENEDRKGQLLRRDQENQQLQNDLNLLAIENQNRQGQLLRRDQDNQQLRNYVNLLVRENRDLQGQLLRKGQENQQLMRENRDQQEQSSRMDHENEQLKNIIVDFSFSLVPIDYYKRQIQKNPKYENFFKQQFDEKIKTEYMPPRIQGFDMHEMRTRIFDEFARFEKSMNPYRELINEIQAKKVLEGMIHLMNQKEEEMKQALETERENLRNLNLDHQQLQQALKDAEKAQESAKLRSIRSFILVNVTSLISLFILRC